MDSFSLRELAKRDGYHFDVIYPWDDTYQEKMTIWNKRTQTSPAMIAYCQNVKDIQFCINWCKINNFPLRVRSGGHHHEGMSSAFGVLIIDLSLMNQLTWVDDDTAWIQPGMQLQKVYAELATKGRIIPGGGCETVCVGGLTLGGGWGMSARHLGLTCDTLLEAEIVLADGTVKTVNDTVPDGGLRELFWALKGGGAGNFGIVTKFTFNLYPISVLTTFTITWTGSDAQQIEQIERILDHWLAQLSSYPETITTVCRLSRNEHGAITLLMMGQIFGTQDDAQAYTNPYTSIYPPVSTTFTEEIQNLMPASNTVLLTEKSQRLMPASNTARPSGLLGGHHFTGSKHESPRHPGDGKLPPPSDTCLTGPVPHKVSSAFANNATIHRIGKECIQYLQDHGFFPGANTYVSLHSFGGAISRFALGHTAFPYRDRLLLLQFQAWWSDPYDEETANYIQWIKNFRSALAGLTDGGFFNFQDASITENKDQLLKYYFGDNLDKLMAVKTRYDSGNMFQSGMSIPVLTSSLGRLPVGHKYSFMENHDA